MTFHRQPRVWVLALATVTAMLAGAALLLHGQMTVSQALPEMAHTPVQLSNGTYLHVQRYEVSVAEWNLCYASGGCALQLRLGAGFDPFTTPATGLSHVDASSYVKWINEATGLSFRLPSLSEWEEMARSVSPDKPDPLFTDPALSWASTYLITGSVPRQLRKQGSFSITPEGIVDLDGSVWEWTQDCYGGLADGIETKRCPAFYVGGEHIAVVPYLVRDPARGGCAVGVPPAHLGFRLVSQTPFQ